MIRLIRLKRELSYSLKILKRGLLMVESEWVQFPDLPRLASEQPGEIRQGSGEMFLYLIQVAYWMEKMRHRSIGVFHGGMRNLILMFLVRQMWESGEMRILPWKTGEMYWYF